MTPQLQQAIRLLQLSTIELNLEVQQALDSNMMLETAEDDVDGGPASQDEKPESADKAVATEQEVEPTNASGVEDIPTDLPVDTGWDDIYDGATSSGGNTGMAMDFQDQRAPGASMQDQLMWQLQMANMSKTDEVIAMAIIDSINEDGYLGASLEEIHETLGGDVEVETDEIAAVLSRIQSFDPAGIAAQDLPECLRLQLAQVDPDTPWLAQAQELVEQYLDLLAGRDFRLLMRRMKLDREDLQQVIALIQSLNPRPGSLLDSQSVEYIIPDVYVRKRKGVWQVDLNQEAIPSLRVNAYYASLIKRADNSAENTSLKNHLQEARWFIKSLQSRSETLLRVASAIVERQQAFLEYGDEAMKPLVLHDIAETLGMHESTISRVTTRKYMHTPRGIYELKYFFSSHVSTTLGGEASSTAIRAVIKKLIAAENVVKPMSDSKIAHLLSDQGIKVARRTVAKYRESMHIPPSNERKQLG